MPAEASAGWRDRASGFFSSSGVKLRQAGHSAGLLAKDAGENVVDAAERVGSLLKSRWAVIQQARLRRPAGPPRETVQERFISAAATTGMLLRKGVTETKEKVVVGKIKVEEAAKKTADKSKVIISNIERWQKVQFVNNTQNCTDCFIDIVLTFTCMLQGVASNDVFGVPIEVIVQRQHSIRPIPEILVKCADYLIMSGLHTEYLFKAEGDKKVVSHLISLFNQDWNASLPEGVNAIDVAALMKCYLASLPEPLTTLALYQEIRGSRSSIQDMKNILKKLPNVCFMTLEFVTALLLRVSQKSSLNKMDASSLALELAPVIMWQQGDARVKFYGHLYHTSKGRSKTVDQESKYAANDYLLDGADSDDASSQIPLDDGPPPDYGAIEVIQCLIEHHNAIFTDANETIWR
ncbi:putative Rho GTPase-activating protein [Apostasia shenzhenica]|uniref:Putative Rho GTPase-activating protein n=1 Tax=Apostasia shenzhenica TaxID=1088818 RepID=A0A2I0B8K8_9ASPA|nr:putative Rho GTPase-activating protein [Apostasia shenzhenica]